MGPRPTETPAGPTEAAEPAAQGRHGPSTPERVACTATLSLERRSLPEPGSGRLRGPPGRGGCWGRRDTCPAACHDFSKTQEDSRGLQGNGTGQQVAINSLPHPHFTTKVARRRRLSKRAAQGSIPAASTARTASDGGPPPPPAITFWQRTLPERALHPLHDCSKSMFACDSRLGESRNEAHVWKWLAATARLL